MKGIQMQMLLRLGDVRLDAREHGLLQRRMLMLRTKTMREMVLMTL